MSIFTNIGNAFDDILSQLADSALEGFGDGVATVDYLDKKTMDLRYPSSLSDNESGADFIFNSNKPNINVDPHIVFELYESYLDYAPSAPGSEPAYSAPWGETGVMRWGPQDYKEGFVNNNYSDNAGIGDVAGLYGNNTEAQLKNQGKIKEKKIRSIALYMTPSIEVNDQINYETNTRATMAATQERDGLGGEDLKMASSHSLSEGLTAMAGLSIFGGSGKLSKLAGVGIGATAGAAKLVGDEHIRLSGNVFNPNEYMHFKNTALRTFNFGFKFLPDNENESNHARMIIQAFRAAARPKKKSALTMGSPYKVKTSFMGVSHMIKLPPTFISSVTVNYNPNSASYFRRNGAPVEIDFSFVLQEIMPLYRGDIEGTDAGTAGLTGMLSEGNHNTPGGY